MQIQTHGKITLSSRLVDGNEVRVCIMEQGASSSHHYTGPSFIDVGLMIKKCPFVVGGTSGSKEVEFYLSAPVSMVFSIHGEGSPVMIVTDLSGDIPIAEIAKEPIEDSYAELWADWELFCKQRAKSENRIQWLEFDEVAK